jgi:hypothetical protein
MSRRIDIELTSAREDGSWTWRAAGAREPRGTVDGTILPSGTEVGAVLRVEIEGHLDGLNVVAVVPAKTARAEPERLELKSSGGADQPLVTTALAPGRSGERRGRGDRGDRSERGERGDRGRRGERARDERARDERGRGPDGGRRERRDDRRDRPARADRDRQEGRHERSSRPAPPPVETKPKPKRLRPGRTHRSALLESVPAEQRPIAEQLLLGGIPSVRQAIDKQNAELRAAGKPEVKADQLLRVAEDLRPRALAAVWRDRAEAAVASVDELDLRDLRSVVNAAGDAGRDEEARALASQLREALAARVEQEHNAWLAELAETVQAGRVVRALRLSSRPPKAGAMIPGEVATQLAEATAASLTEDTGPERWATVLDALAYSPLRRRVIPQSLPAKLNPDLRATIARLASRLPEIAHIFDIESDPGAERAARNQARRRPARKGEAGGKGGAGGKGESRGESREGGRGEGGRSRKGGDRKPRNRDRDRERPAATAAPAAPEAEAPATAPQPAATATEPAEPQAEAPITPEVAAPAEAPTAPEAEAAPATEAEAPAAPEAAAPAESTEPTAPEAEAAQPAAAAAPATEAAEAPAAPEPAAPAQPQTTEASAASHDAAPAETTETPAKDSAGSGQPEAANGGLTNGGADPSTGDTAPADEHAVS